MIMKIVLYVYKYIYIFINVLKWNVDGWIFGWLQQTLYTKCISESVLLCEVFYYLVSCCWVWSFCCATIFAWCWFSCFPVSCYRLAKARPKVWRPPPSLTSAALESPAASASPWLCSSQEGGSPSSRLSQGDVPLCGSETPLCWAVCSTQVWTLVSRPCITSYLSSVEGWGGRQDELFLVLPVGLSYFCMLEWCWPWLCMWMWHFLSWYFIKTCLGWTSLFALRNVDVHLFIRNAAEAHLSFFLSFFPSLVFYWLKLSATQMH